jgi:GNAT superfamily N-acetyltransferase
MDVARARVADVPVLAQALAAAFDDDPLMAWLLPDHRLPRLRRLFGLYLRTYLPHDCVYTDEAGSGAALWAPPGKWKTRLPQLAVQAPAWLRVLGRRVPAGLRLLTLMERHHPREPHYYLAAIGVRPDGQGRGVGAALLAPVLDRCDGEGLPAYLESSKPENIPFYARHGFEVTGEVAVPGGPPIWPMWRNP